MNTHHTTRRRFQIALITWPWALAVPAAHAHGEAHGTAAAPDAAGLPLTEGEVRRVDTAAGKLTLKHGEIKNLGMPPMTMVFQVQDPALLGTVKAGDKVRFTAVQRQGAYTVLSLELVP